MATRPFTVDELRPNVIAVTWSGLLDGDDGAPYESAYMPEKTVQAFGTFGAGGEITWQCSNQAASLPPTDYDTLDNFANKPIVRTDITVDLCAQNARVIRPLISAGTGVNLTAIAILFVTTPGVAIGR